jgi:tetratricopeptide (TPR) repeat protein
MGSTATTTTKEQDFLGRLRPVLEKRDPEHLTDYLHGHTTCDELLEMLDSDDQDTIKVALLCLAGLGAPDHSDTIGRHLRSADPMIVKLAEHALWSIWFRGGDDRANHDLRYIVAMIDEGRLDDAIAAIDQLAERCPDFAEIYHQRAIANFLKGQYVAAAVDCRLTLRLIPCHFAAMAGLANALALRGNMRPALRVYRRACKLYPTMEGLRESMREVCRHLIEHHEMDGPPCESA